ncbi:MAG: AAA domain [Rhodobacteraceae bacterium HLUCCA12]|nr:MAG: AAA domain [Rhodobacteraceae bacterium HLUCCA12]
MNVHHDPFADLPPADDMPPDDRFGPAMEGNNRAAPAKPFPFVAVGDLEYHPPEFLIDGLIETDTLGLIFGDPGCGKSFMAVDLALSVASGAEFHGRGVKQGAVFYIAGEGHNGLVRRFVAWAKHRGRGLQSVPMFKSERAAQFLDGASAMAVAHSVDALAAQHGAPVLIVVDTLARNFGPGDENSTSEMGAFVAAMDDLKARYPGCVLLIVHHSGHAEKQRARGAMALKGALDFEYRLEKDGPSLTLANTKMKDAEPPADLFFSLITVDLDGSVTSAVLTATDAPERREKITPAQRVALSTYEAAAKEHGVWDDGAFRGVHLDHWRDAFYAKHTGDTTDAKKKAFQRVRADLAEAGRIEATDDFYLIRDSSIQLAIVMHRDKRAKAGHVPACPGPSGPHP